MGALQKLEELAEVTRMLIDAEAKSGIEVGMRWGGTTSALCKVTRRLVGVDTRLQFKPLEGDHPGLRAYIGDSTTTKMMKAVSDCVRELSPGGVDFLFIDGDHTYEGVKADFYNYSPMVKPGGLVFFHDIVPNVEDKTMGVRKLWDELSRDYDREGDRGEIICYPGTWNKKVIALDHSNWGGIGWLKMT